MKFQTNSLSEDELINKYIILQDKYVMWYHDRIKAIEWDGQDAKYIQPKYDGHRITIYVQPDNKVGIFGRNFYGTKNNLLSLTKQLSFHQFIQLLPKRVPAYSSLDCELYLPLLPAKDVKTYINNQDQSLKIVPFAIPVWAGKDLSNECLLSIRGMSENVGIPFCPTYKYNKQSEQESLELAQFSNAEGVVLKNSHYSNWYKIKKVNTLDAVVMGFEEGKGKYEFNTGAIKVGLYRSGKLVEIASVSGMTDNERDSIDEKKDIGRVIEIAYQYKTEDNRLRHPRFIQWRDDKVQSECTWDQIKND